MSGTRDAARIVTIVNRRARALAGESPGSRALLDVLRAPRPGVRVIETCSLADLEAAAEEMAREVPDAVVLAGGDGSYMAGVTALVQAFAEAGRGEEALPQVALVPGGTVSTVARNWGFRGGGLTSRGTRDRTSYTSRLLLAASSRRARGTRRPTLRCIDDHASRVGFIVGAGLVARFFEVYEQEGAGGYRGAASIVARVFAGSLGGGALAKRILRPVPCVVEVDGAAAAFDHASLVCASVVRDLGLGMRLLHRAGEETERFHVVALVLAGRPLLGARNVDALARDLALHFGADGDAYVLDGELFRSTRVRVFAGPVLRILSV
jgi:diacylglycerol kinase family enzyme